MTLTTQQLNELTERIVERINEFGPVAESIARISPGVVRLMLDVYAEWQSDVWDEAMSHGVEPSSRYSLADVMDCAEPEPEAPQKSVEKHSNGYHPVVSAPPLKPVATDPDVAREKLAQALASGSSGALEMAQPSRQGARPGMVLPTLDDVLKELRRQSMGGVAPSQEQFNAARPATWATANAHAQRLGKPWVELAELAGLKPRKGGAL